MDKEIVKQIEQSLKDGESYEFMEDLTSLWEEWHKINKNKLPTLKERQIKKEIKDKILELIKKI